MFNCKCVQMRLKQEHLEKDYNKKIQHFIAGLVTHLEETKINVFNEVLSCTAKI